jgi:SAM-dependent methyltransferase
MVPPEVSAAEIAAVTELLRESSDLSSSHLFANAAGAGRHHLSPARANLLRHLELGGLSILELGGGCGGLSRHLAERAARFAGVERRPAHRAALAERLRDLHGARVVAEADGQGLGGESFDLVVVVEDRDGESTEEIAARLAAAKERLRPGGLIALAGGNRLGLGAFAGQPDRRSRTYFEGLAGGDQPGDPLSRREWRRLCADLSLGIEAEYLVSPDVWLPTCVLREELLERDLELASDLICHLPFADGALPAFPLLPPSLLAESLARGGLLAELAPGFLWLLGGPDSRALLGSLAGEGSEPALAWHYAAERLPATRTRFFLRQERLWVSKVAVTAAPPRPHVCWNASPDQPVLRGQRWRQRLIRSAYFEQGNFEQELASLLGQLRQPFAAGPESLEGRALDAIFHNAIFCDDGETRLFDLEWELAGELPTSWWVLRNVLALAPNLETIGRGIGAENLGRLYQRLCVALGVTARLEQDLAAEAELQAELGGQPVQALAPALAALLRRPLESSATPPRHPEDLGGWQDKQERLRGELDTLRAGFASVARMADDLRWLGDKVAELAVSQDQQQMALRSQHESLAQIDGALRWLAGKIVDRP